MGACTCPSLSCYHLSLSDGGVPCQGIGRWDRSDSCSREHSMFLECSEVEGGHQMLWKGVQSGKGKLNGGIQVGVLDMPGGGGIQVQVFSQSCDIFFAHIHHINGILNNWNQIL